MIERLYEIDCKHEFSCEKGKELRTYCPRCGSGNVTIPQTVEAVINIKFLQRQLSQK